MADVEQPGRFAHPQMLGHDAVFILDGHRIARERHHPRALRAVPRIERQNLRLGGIEVGFVAHARPPLSEKTTHRPVPRFRCAAPSVTEPESFHRLRETAYPFGGLGPGPKALSRVSKPHAVSCA